MSRRTVLPLLLVLAILLPVYLSALQTIPNGAEHYYMIDVGETQIVLNLWGTLHATGYPLYVMTGNLLVAILRLIGVSPAAAPGAVSLLWSMAALALVYALAVHVTNRPLISAGMTILLGLTRTVWIHASIAEIYSFGLLLLALLLLVALWRQPIRGRLYWLALTGGIGVFHHRALVMAAPALVYAVWPEFRRRFLPQPHTPWLKHLLNPQSSVLSLFLLGLLGFLPYLYLPLRANAGAAWVYGEPGTWDGFWDQFLGREASRFIGAPDSWDGLAANVNLVNNVLVTDLTLPGIGLGLLGLLLALRNPARRRAAITMLLSGGAAYGFHIALYTDILSALILPVTLSLAFGWLWLAEWALSGQFSVFRLPGGQIARLGTGIVSLLFGAVLVSQNLPFIQGLTRDETGLQTIALARETPPGSALMLDWGPRHFAVGFARDVLRDFPAVDLLDHKADFRAVIEQKKLVTPDFTFYNRPVSWWEAALGTKVYLNAAAPHLVEISTAPERANMPLSDAITVVEQTVECAGDGINLRVAWGTAEQPDHDLSVFVHLLDADGQLVAQADQSAPVYGWRPLTTWEAGEIVRDVYPLPMRAEGETIRFGLYRQAENGEFHNEYVYEARAECGG